MASLLRVVRPVARGIFLDTPTNANIWIILLVWTTRLIVLASLFRTWIAPAVIKILSKRLRLRSVSLRSIRGLYLRTSRAVYTVDRIKLGWRWVSLSKTVRLKVTIEGMCVEMLQPAKRKKPSQPLKLNARMRSLAQLKTVTNPLSPSIFAVISYVVRPTITTAARALLRLVVLALPTLTQVIEVELDNTKLSSRSHPGVFMTMDTINLSSHLAFSKVERPPTNGDTPSAANPLDKISKLSSYWSFFTVPSGERAWATVQASAHLSLTVSNLNLFMEKSGIRDLGTSSILQLHQGIKLELGAHFLPSRLELDLGGLNASLNLGSIEIHLEELLSVIKSLKRAKHNVAGENTDSGDLLSPSESETLQVPMSPGRLRSMDPFGAFRKRTRRSQLQMKQKNHVKPWLSYLQRVSIRSSSITVVVAEVLPCQLVVRQISVAANVSEPHAGSLHQEVLGYAAISSEGAYSLTCNIHEVLLSRTPSLVSRSLPPPRRSLGLSNISLSVLSKDWPKPLISPNSVLTTDLNDSLVAVRFAIRNIDVTEHLDVIRILLAHQPPANPNPTSPLAAQSPPISRFIAYFGLPKVQFNLFIDRISGETILTHCPDDSTTTRFQISTSAIALQGGSSYYTPKNKSDPRSPPMVGIPTSLEYSSVLNTGRISFMARTTSVENATPKLDSSESILLVDPMEICATGTIAGHASDDQSAIMYLDYNTLVADTLLSSETISLELWHSKTVKALTYLLAHLRTKSSTQTQPPSMRPLHRLPFGLSLKVGVRRLTAFVTSEDLNPEDSYDMSRGLALRTSIVASYSAFKQNSSAYTSAAMMRGQLRQRLHLPEERIIQASAAARASRVTNQDGAFGQCIIRNLMVRAALATPFAADDPYFDTTKGHHRIIVLPTMVADCTIRTQRSLLGVPDIAGINISIPGVTMNVHMSDMYHTLLAASRLQLLTTPKEITQMPSKKSRNLSAAYTINIAKIDLRLHLPLHQQLYVNFRALECRLPSSGAKAVQVATLTASVPPMPGKSAWREFIRIDSTNVQFPGNASHPLKISVGSGARIRIPHGFLLNEFIRGISVAAKSIKHLSYMVRKGAYEPMDMPEAEGPKSIPLIQAHINDFSFEIADDPLETKLALQWRVGVGAARARMERDDAFLAKVAAINGADTATSAANVYNFDDRHSIPVNEARARLLQVHALDWTERYKEAREALSNAHDVLQRELWGDSADLPLHQLPVKIDAVAPDPPLLRFRIQKLTAHISGPSFPVANLPKYLFERGGGIPLSTQYSLLVPLHLQLSMVSACLTARAYPIPLFNLPAREDGGAALTFDTDLVIAEEMGTEMSVDWIDCVLVDEDEGRHNFAPFTFRIPKTIMPVKTYADPVISVQTGGITDFAWGVSYSPVTQDLLRAIDTFTSSPLDPSPPVGFWDKLRLSLHWTVQVTFEGEIHMHMKGSRDPHDVVGDGAGFVLCWSGRPRLWIGHPNEQRELLQVEGDQMVIAIPDFENLASGATNDPLGINAMSYQVGDRKHRKVCAKFSSGVRFGIGVILERACGAECQTCSGSAFHRACRFFDFKPHYQVFLETKGVAPELKSDQDSYNGFRSDYLHLSVSLSSSIRKTGMQGGYSSGHLSPHTFTHFWSWLSLFERTLSLPIRQGRMWPTNMKTPSPKLGKHIATIKYRVTVPNLFIAHTYMDNSRDAWAEGLTPIVGIKANIGYFQADLHQREEESLIPAEDGTIRAVRRKPFHAAEVVLKDMELRTLLALFKDTSKQAVPLESVSYSSRYRSNPQLPTTSTNSQWVDRDDFTDVDWAPDNINKIHLIPTATCPQFTYFKHAPELVVPGLRTQVKTSKFGDEDTHTCHLGKEPSVAQTQVDLAMERVQELRSKLQSISRRRNDKAAEIEIEKKIALLEAYIVQLRADDTQQDARSTESYYIPAHNVQPEEWADFDNVYQVHNPKISMNSAIRDILMQYYYCSRARRGFEYHMATRAVQFIRDQAEITMAAMNSTKKKPLGAMLGGHNPANALRKMLHPENNPRISVLMSDAPSLKRPDHGVDPLNGWSDGVSLNKSHFCLLLKPQIVLSSDITGSSVCLLAATQATAQTFAIMDEANADDPISGRIMTRSYTSLSNLQMFAPSKTRMPEDRLPLEVLVDLRCESQDFDRIVPQTDASFQYDKFNQLRLRNNVVSVVQTKNGTSHGHLHHQMVSVVPDLIKIHVPSFTVGATDRHLQSMSDVLTHLVLFTDAVHKTRAEKLETMLFRYDFTDLLAVADVVSDIQSRLRHVVELERGQRIRLTALGEPGRMEILRMKAQALSLAEELNLIFDAIKSAQDKVEDQSDRKSALMLRASSDEISWRMLDEQRDLLAKLAVRNIDFSWLSRTDSSTVNKLVLGDLQAFAGSHQAVWAEILSKSEESANHPLAKRGCFLLADWTLLAPVGGIAIYERFEVILHPMRLQIETKMGAKLMEYVWPERRRRKQAESPQSLDPPRKRRDTEFGPNVRPAISSRTSMDSPRTPDVGKSLDMSRLDAPPLRRMATSRSFTDLRSATIEQQLRPKPDRSSSVAQASAPSEPGHAAGTRTKYGDAEEMKTRSAQKTFVLVRIPSLSLLLSVWKEGSFLCQDARITTRDLEYKNQTWSMEELVEQFIPSDPSWKGWVKMALHQPLIPVLPVARELFTKTKWIARKGGQLLEFNESSVSELEATRRVPTRTSQSTKRSKSSSRPTTANGMKHSTSEPPLPRTTSPQPIDAPVQVGNRNIMMRLLRRPKRSVDIPSTIPLPRDTQEYTED